MLQITFSPQSLLELAKLGQLEQLGLVQGLNGVSESLLNHPREPISRFTRDGHTLFRLRSGEYRLYFERQKSTLHTLCILHRNTLTDFIYRAKLPITEEQLIEQHSSFWKYLETLKR